MVAIASARRGVVRAGNSRALELSTRVGLAGYGVLHLAIAWLAIQIAIGRSTTEGDQSGAFRLLVAQPFGRILVWVVAIGLVAMAIWQLSEAAVGHLDETGGRRSLERVVSLSRTVIYAALAWTAYRVVEGAATSAAQQQQHATAGMLGSTGGRFLAGAIGVAVTMVGLVIAGYGLTKGFEKNFVWSQVRRRTRTAAVLAGQVGYAAKGLAYAVVGILLVVAAVSFDPQRSTGLDGALRALAGEPFGVFLLGFVTFGFAVFGVFCFFQSRHRKV
jgi:hypothetical protein